MPNPLLRLIAWTVHEVVSEYRRLDPPPSPPAESPCSEINNTAASTAFGFTGYQRRPADARAEDGCDA